jgi:hypothetical protein
MHYGRLPFSVHQKMPALPVLLVENASTSKWTACAIATTIHQPKLTAEQKTAVSANNTGSRSSRAVFPSSSNLKNKTC